MEQVDATVTIELGGKPRILEYTLYAIEKLRKLTGKNVLKGEVDGQDPEFLFAFAWAGLIQHDETLDGLIVEGKPTPELQKNLDQVAKWMGSKKLTKLYTSCMTALVSATPKKKDEDDETSGEGEGKK